MSDTTERVLVLLADALRDGSLVRLVLSDPRDRAAEVRRVTVRPVTVRGRALVQIEEQRGAQTVHRNLDPGAALGQLAPLLRGPFRQAKLHTTRADYQIALKRAGRAAVVERAASRAPAPAAHDREKPRTLPEGQPLEFLVRLGIMAANGRVASARRGKFAQINRFLELVADVADALPTDRPITAVDFGCGKGALTFALYHYLTAARGLAVRMVGVDRKADVIAASERLARELGFEGLRFVVGDIAGFDEVKQADMVVALHACDTATDDALAWAVRHGARMILAAPCCQHELSHRIAADALRPMLKHGLLRERMAALVTDALRAGLLEAEGYTVQLVEFVDPEHTPKNLLIRAVRTAAPAASTGARRAEYERLRDFWHAAPALEGQLGQAEDSRRPPCRGE